MPALESGIVVMWAGAIVDIPAGYVLCDGTHGTPDLRDRFIIGAGHHYPVGATGGSTQHTHTFTGDGHPHGIPGGLGLMAGLQFANATTVDPATGTTDPTSHLPRYYALAFIMKT